MIFFKCIFAVTIGFIGVSLSVQGVTLPADYAPTCVTCDEEGTASQNGAVSTNEQRNQER